MIQAMYWGMCSVMVSAGCGFDLAVCCHYQHVNMIHTFLLSFLLYTCTLSQHGQHIHECLFRL